MSHWYSWFPGDYLRGTQHLSMIEDAAYRRLLDAYYMTGKLSANADILLRICRAVTADEQEAVRKIAAEFFEQRDGLLYQDKVEREIAYSLSISAKRSSAGKKGAARTNGKRSAYAASNAAASASTNPRPHVNLPPTEGAIAPRGANSIFGYGLQFLTAKGVSEKSARGFLGLMRKEHGDGLVAEAIAKAETEDISDPLPWLRQYLAGRTSAIGRTGAKRKFLAEIRSETLAELTGATKLLETRHERDITAESSRLSS